MKEKIIEMKRIHAFIFMIVASRICIKNIPMLTCRLH